MKITVTDNIIKASILLLDVKGKDLVCLSSLCPVSLALDKQTDYNHWSVLNNEAVETEFGKHFLLPKNVVNFLKSWSKGKVVKPVSFYAPEDQVKIDIKDII